MASEQMTEVLGIDPKRARDVRVLVLTGYGLNCEAETQAGFEMAGASVELAHVGDVVERGGAQLDGRSVVAFIGGFSFGDHVASGTVYANRLRTKLGDRLARYVDDGGLAIGMCNGFQTMVKLGLLPAEDRSSGEGLAEQSVSLVSNERHGYWDAWVRMRINPKSPCVFTRGLEHIELPSRHGEGKFVFRDEAQRERLEASNLVPLHYCRADGRADGEATMSWPDNPNGSPGGAAALCDASGRLFGLMPHPEAYLYPHNHPRWICQRDEGTLPPVGTGLRLLANGVRAAVGDE